VQEHVQPANLAVRAARRNVQQAHLVDARFSRPEIALVEERECPSMREIAAGFQGTVDPLERRAGGVETAIAPVKCRQRRARVRWEAGNVVVRRPDVIRADATLVEDVFTGREHLE
jgi:hypothetical protein